MAKLTMPISKGRPTPINSKEMTVQDMVNYVDLKHFFEEAQSLMYLFNVNPLKHIKG